MKYQRIITQQGKELSSKHDIEGEKKKQFLLVRFIKNLRKITTVQFAQIYSYIYKIYIYILSLYIFCM